MAEESMKSDNGTERESKRILATTANKNKPQQRIQRKKTSILNGTNDTRLVAVGSYCNFTQLRLQSFSHIVLCC